jgi:hypothetical protein
MGLKPMTQSADETSRRLAASLEQTSSTQTLLSLKRRPHFKTFNNSLGKNVNAAMGPNKIRNQDLPVWQGPALYWTLITNLVVSPDELETNNSCAGEDHQLDM